MAVRVTGLTLNLRGLNRLMASNTMQGLINEKGQEIARRAGSNFEYVQRRHKWTARGYVQATNQEGREEEARDKVLTRAVGVPIKDPHEGLVRYTRKRDGKTIWATPQQVHNWTRGH